MAKQAAAPGTDRGGTAKQAEPQRDAVLGRGREAFCRSEFPFVAKRPLGGASDESPGCARFPRQPQPLPFCAFCGSLGFSPYPLVAPQTAW